MIETAEGVALIIASGLILVVGVSFLLLDLYRPHHVDEEIANAIERLEAEEKRFRVGEIDRRNLAQ